MGASSAEPRGVLQNAALYGLFGCIASSIDAILFTVLYYNANVPWQISNIFSVIAGMTVSFILNRRFNFRVLDHPLRRALIFFSVGACGLLLSQSVLWAGAFLSFDMLASKLISVVLVAGFQFTLNKLISFGIVFSDTRSANV